MARELGQDARDLVALVALELAQPVGELDDRERLDEQRLARVAGVVDDARHGAACARAHGDDGPAAALGDEILLQMRLEVGIRRERAQPVAGAPARRRELGAERLQLRRGRVLDARRIELERALEPVGDDRQRLGDLVGARRRAAAPLAALGQVPAHAERRARRLGDRDEPLGAERPAATRVIGVDAHVVRARHPRRALLDEHQRLGAERLPRARPRRRPARAAAPRRARGWPRRTCGSPAARESRRARARRARDRPSRRRIGAARRPERVGCCGCSGQVARAASATWPLEPRPAIGRRAEPADPRAVLPAAAHGAVATASAARTCHGVSASADLCRGHGHAAHADAAPTWLLDLQLAAAAQVQLARARAHGARRSAAPAVRSRSCGRRRGRRGRELGRDAPRRAADVRHACSCVHAARASPAARSAARARRAAATLLAGPTVGVPLALRRPRCRSSCARRSRGRRAGVARLARCLDRHELAAAG